MTSSSELKKTLDLTDVSQIGVVVKDMDQAVGFDASRIQLAAVLNDTAEQGQEPAVDALVEQQLTPTKAG